MSFLEGLAVSTIWRINLASRLEGLNRVYGTESIIGENTAQLVDGAFVLRELDMVRVKGRTQAVRIYELESRSVSGCSRSASRSGRRTGRPGR